MAVTIRKHAIEVGDRVYFGGDVTDTGTVREVWFGQPHDYPGGFHDHWRVLAQWDTNAHTGEAPGELTEFEATSVHPVKK